MDMELKILINRTELAAERAEKSGFFETARALGDIASMLGRTGPITVVNAKLLHVKL